MSDDLMAEMGIYAAMGAYGDHPEDVLGDYGMTFLGMRGGGLGTSSSSTSAGGAPVPPRGPPPPPGAGLAFCSVCQCNVPGGEENMKKHESGKRHQQEAKKQHKTDAAKPVGDATTAAQPPPPPPSSSSSRLCVVCKVKIPEGADQLRLHEAGARHKNNLKKQQLSGAKPAQQEEGVLKRGRTAEDQQHRAPPPRGGGGATASSSSAAGPKPYDPSVPHLHPEADGSYGMAYEESEPCITHPDQVKLVTPQLRVVRSSNMPGRVLLAIAQRCPRLAHLNLNGNQNVSGSHLLQLAGLCRYIEWMDVKYASSFTFAQFKEVVKLLPRLKFFDVRETQCGRYLQGPSSPNVHDIVRKGLLVDL